MRLPDGVMVLLAVTLGSCIAPSVRPPPEVTQFIQLLVQRNEPSLADYERFAGDGDPSEIELGFEERECNSRGWSLSDERCLRYTRDRWLDPGAQQAMFLSWFRRQFDTVGKPFRVIGIQRYSEGFSHNLIEVDIGRTVLILFENTEPGVPTGMLVGVSKINGKSLESFLP